MDSFQYMFYFSVAWTVCGTVNTLPTGDLNGMESIIERCNAVLEAFPKLEANDAQQNIKIRELEDIIEKQHKIIQILLDKENYDDASEIINGITPSERRNQVSDTESHATSTSCPESDVDDNEDRVDISEDIKKSTRIQNNGQDNGVRAIIQEPRFRRASLPREMAFSAYLNWPVEHLPAGHVIKCDKVLINDGTSYNPVTGLFTVPIEGVYLLTFTIDSYTETHIKLLTDGINTSDAVSDPQILRSTYEMMGGNTIIVRLRQGQSVWLESYNNADGQVIGYDDARLTTFSGVLLY